jgi:hypothetical protein|tara:strand:+ start:293 stop:856 length:564 start_codon:yes stop_codon:yes gene_type:complete
MNNISTDCFSIILQNLKCQDIDNLKCSSKQINNDCKELSIIYKNTKIQEIWGKEIFKIIYNTTNLHQKENYEIFLNNNKLNTIKKVLELFYYDIIFNDSTLTSRKFIEIYNIFFNHSVKINSFKDFLYEHRSECLLKMLKKEEIHMENESLKKIFNVSTYINRYHGILGRRIRYDEFILDLKQGFFY